MAFRPFHGVAVKWAEARLSPGQHAASSGRAARTCPGERSFPFKPELGRPEKNARLVHNAFLLQFLVAMPWLKPKQVREARIYVAANVFKGPLIL